jgi:cell division septation protein DedD
MSASRRTRVLLAAVFGTTLALVGLLRWAGRIAGRAALSAAPARSGDPARAGAAAGTPELSFYRALGGGGAAPGRRDAAPLAEGRSMRPAPGDVVAPVGAYVVQVMATRDQKQAERLHDRLSRRGYASSIVADDVPGGPIYRVRIGRWKERGPADAMAKAIRDKEGLEPWVLQEGGP